MRIKVFNNRIEDRSRDKIGHIQCRQIKNYALNLTLTSTKVSYFNYNLFLILQPYVIYDCCYCVYCTDLKI